MFDIVGNEKRIFFVTHHFYQGSHNMPLYAIMQNPGHNRVYFKSAQTLAQNEIGMVCKQLSSPAQSIHATVIGGIPYIMFEADKPLTEKDLSLLSRLSFTYALFELPQHSQATGMVPLTVRPPAFFPDEINTYLKYTGKTNELFTRMMLNLASVCGSHKIGERLRVLDPVCGKGTTLFECLQSGYDAYGVDIDGVLVREAHTFLKRYLETARYKHESHVERVGCFDADDRPFTATRYRTVMARDKEGQKSGNSLHAEMVDGDTRFLNQYFKKETFHAIVGDLPYGVLHVSKKKGIPSASRNAADMLKDALPGWVGSLKIGGVMVLAWNLFLIPRQTMESLFLDHGMRLPYEAQQMKMAHRVDQAIERDLIIGIKTDPRSKLS